MLVLNPIFSLVIYFNIYIYVFLVLILPGKNENIHAGDIPPITKNDYVPSNNWCM